MFVFLTYIFFFFMSCALDQVWFQNRRWVQLYFCFITFQLHNKIHQSRKIGKKSKIQTFFITFRVHIISFHFKSQMEETKENHKCIPDSRWAIENAKNIWQLVQYPHVCVRVMVICMISFDSEAYLKLCMHFTLTHFDRNAPRPYECMSVFKWNFPLFKTGSKATAYVFFIYSNDTVQLDRKA